MDRIAAGPSSDRRDLFRESASRLGMNPAIVEKDFWVCWILKLLFEEPALKNQMVFKGGTSLSKVFGLIERFSEDIDLGKGCTGDRFSEAGLGLNGLCW
jgi:predicted nucleotidyltransferase component of viral defense system